MINKNSELKLDFLGAAQTVTGSKYLITSHGQRFLVDCGLFQGLKDLRLKNWNLPSFDASSIDSVILTHAHIDHSGYLPRLVKHGFRGKVFCSQGTFELAKVLLLDAAHIMEEEAALANSSGYTRHNPALPLFTTTDANHALSLFHPIALEKELKIGEHIGFTLYQAGHILGSTFCIFHHRKKSIDIGFSGDIGRPNDAIMKPPVDMPPVHYLVLESTYGNRVHDTANASVQLEALINDCCMKKSVLVIPAFAVGRAQEILFYLAKLRKAGKLKGVGVYLDSPMAGAVTDLYLNRLSDHRLSADDCKSIHDTVRITRTAVDSISLYRKPSPKIIISASGMATGGRVLHHLKNYLSHPDNVILFTGYQAAGTRGRFLVEGQKKIKIHGVSVPVSARIFNLESLSAHADRDEILTWLSKSQINPRRVFITHGEPDASFALCEELWRRFNWECVVPNMNYSYELA